jgi:hypothetical protein
MLINKSLFLLVFDKPGNVFNNNVLCLTVVEVIYMECRNKFEIHTGNVREILAHLVVFQLIRPDSGIICAK